MRLKRLAVGVTVALAGLVGVGASQASATHQQGSSLCVGTGWVANNTARAELTSQQTTNCRIKAAVRCGGGGWQAASVWRPMGQISSIGCSGVDVTANGWYTTLAH